MQESIEELKSEIKKQKAEVADLDKKIAAKARDQGSAVDPKMEELRDKIKHHQELLQNMTRARPTKEKEANDATAACEAAEQAQQAKEALRDDAIQALDQARRNLQPFARASRNGLEKFGNNIGVVMDRIKRATWRAGPPLGPLGQYVQLEDESYRGVLESLLGSLMCQFAVRCDEDRLTLLKILTECSRTQGYAVAGMMSKFPPVLQWRGDLFDYSRGDLSSRGETVLSKLKFSNEEVLRIFINQARIERVFLARTAHAGKDLIDRLLAANVSEQIVVYSADMKNQQGRAK